ncbi:MAG: SUMF1/EgtB/PvdO family nonheme iron enzyme [Blastocatellia bacterium]|nr:SUMF1/EgtB/PvdO family nonheme iron enzyme [Blastocatellia bacterium]
MKKADNHETSSYAESHALIIGVSKYTLGWSELPDVVNDVKEVRKILLTHGFSVETLLDPTNRDLVDKIKAFISDFGQNYNSRLLIYFSGHGHTLQTSDNTQRELGYIIQSDTPLARPDDPGPFKKYAISMEELISYSAQIESKHVLFIFDSCFSGSVFNVRSGKSHESIPEAIIDKLSEPVRQFITAGNEKQKVPATSKFRRVFVNALKGDADTNRDGYITGTELGEYLHEQVSTNTNRQQTPQHGKILDPTFNRGDFVFEVPGKKPEPTARDAERNYWRTIERSTDPRPFREYIERFGPNGIYHNEAQAKIKYFEALELENAYWRRVENSSNPQDFRDYITRFGEKAIHHTAALKRMNELEAAAAEQAHWRRIETSDNPQDFRDYVARYKERGIYYNNALAAINRLEALESERAYWRSIENSKKPEDFRGYIRKYDTQGIYYSIASSRVKELEAEQSHWQRIEASIDPQDFFDYIDKYGASGIYNDIAIARIRELEAAATERHIWRSIENSKNPQEFRDYISKYPNGKFVGDAREKLRALETASRPPSPLPSTPNRRERPPEATGNPTVSGSTNRSRNEAGLSSSSRIPANTLPLPSVSPTTVILDERGKIVRQPAVQAKGFVEDLGGVRLEMVEITGGTFMMGSPVNEAQRNDDETPLHQVNISGFFMGRYEITQAQWRAVARLPKEKIDLNPNPSKFRGDTLPVEQVSWEEAVEFCERLSKATGRKYRLPSEAEWEYACRAGTTTPFHFGETLKVEYVNYDGGFPYKSAPKGDYRQKTIPVGSLRAPNLFGLFDMHGNVSEWCADSWLGNYNGAPEDGSAWDVEAARTHRVVRGGNWFKQARDARSAARDRYPMTHRSTSIGFRVVVAL